MNSRWASATSSSHIRCRKIALALGECDLKFPYQVPENRYFVMGDHRSTSIDSRSTVIGCVDKSQIVGKVFLRVWPLSRLSWVH